jgi:hypothetical protein
MGEFGFDLKRALVRIHKGDSIRQVARETGFDRGTLSKYYKLSGFNPSDVEVVQMGARPYLSNNSLF